MSNMRMVRVADRTQFRAALNSYAGQGFVMIHSDNETASLSRKKPVNWGLAIVCLFFPIIGWIALGYMLYAASRGSEVVEIVIDDTATAARELPEGA